MARSFKVISRFQPDIGFGRITIVKETLKDQELSHWNPADKSWYLSELVADDETVLGWELSNADEYLSGADYAFKDFQEPEALLIDPVYAPEGTKLKDLIRRVYERSQSPALSAGIGP